MNVFSREYAAHKYSYFLVIFKDCLCNVTGEEYSKKFRDIECILLIETSVS